MLFKATATRSRKKLTFWICPECALQSFSLFFSKWFSYLAEQNVRVFFQQELKQSESLSISNFELDCCSSWFYHQSETSNKSIGEKVRYFTVFTKISQKRFPDFLKLYLIRKFFFHSSFSYIYNVFIIFF